MNVAEPGKKGRIPGWVWVFGALAVSVVAAWVALAMLFPPARVRALVEREVGAALARPVRFEDARVGLWPPVRLTVRAPAVAERGGFEQGTMLSARALNVDLDVLALLGNRVVVRRLELDEPALHVVLEPDGGSNLDGLGGAPAGARPAAGPAMDLAVRRLGIRRGRVLVDDLKTSRRVAFALDARIALSVRGSGRVDTEGETVVSRLAFGPLTAARASELDPALAQLDWRIEHRGAFDPAQNRLAFEKLALRLGRASLSFSGLIQEPGPRAWLDLRARGNAVDLGQILAFLARADAPAVRGVRGGGRLDFDLAVRGRLVQGGAPGASRLPDVTGTLRLADASLRYPGAPAGIEALSCTARFAPDSLGIGDLEARVAGQPLTARFAVTRFADPRVSFAVRGDVDLAAVAPLFAPRDGSIAGRAAVDLRGSGRARDPQSMALDGRAQLSGVRVRHPGLPSEITNLGGTIEFSATRARVAGLSAQAGKSSFTLDARVARPLALVASMDREPRPAPAELDFDFRSPYLDVAELLPPGGGALVLPNARGGGRVAIDRLRNGKLDLERVRADVALEPGVLAAPRFGAVVYGGQASGSARFDMRDTTRPVVAVQARLDSARVERLLGAWVPPGDWLEGGLSTSIDLDGDLSDLRRSLTAAGLALVWSGSLGGLPVLDRLASLASVPGFKRITFSDLRSSFKLENGRVFTGPATLHGPEGEWQVSGSVGLDGTLDYVASVTLPPSVVERLGARAALAAGALADDQGRLLMDFRVTGPARAPRVAWDPGTMRARLEGRVSEALAEQRQRFEQQVRDSVDARRRAVEDSARAAVERYRRAARDSLERKARDLLKGFFGSAPDTARR